MIIRNEKGFTLIEALIAALILGMVILVWSSLEVFTSSVVKKVSNFSNAQKVIINIVNDVLVSEKGLPPSAPPTELAKAAVTRAQLTSVFNDLESKQMTKQICYDIRSNLITTAAEMAKSCYYKVAFFKYRLDDRTFTNATLKEIPLSRVLIRIQYLDPNPPEGKKAENLTRFVTRLVSNVAEF